MGISINTLAILLTKRELFFEKNILAIGLQFPPKWYSIKKFQKSFSHLLSNKELNLLEHSTNKTFQKVLFIDILNAKNIETIDISSDECANHLWNLNCDINESDLNIQKLIGTYDIVIEGGTIEHISNTNIYINNIFLLLQINGLYISNTPSSGYFEHGFFQFSPTFFADICYKNNEIIELVSLLIHDNESQLMGLSLSDYYNENLFDNSLYTINRKEDYYFHKNYIEKNIYTGTLLNLVNKINLQFDVFAMIKKKVNHEVSFNFIQNVYRKSSLSTILPNIDLQIIKNNNEKSNFKKLFLKLPIPGYLKYRLITIIYKLNYILKNNFS